MFWTLNIIFELHSLGYDRFPIQNVPFILIKFNGDVLLKPPQVENSKSHFSEMQRMDKNYDGHAWSKVKTRNIKSDFILAFHKV
jgi:hypothetical protein